MRQADRGNYTFRATSEFREGNGIKAFVMNDLAAGD